MQALKDIFDLIKAHPSASGPINLTLIMNPDDGSWSILAPRIDAKGTSLEDVINKARTNAIRRAQAAVRRLGASHNEEVSARDYRDARVQSYRQSILKLNEAIALLKNV